jgi:methyl-accepting chemotaxis protein
MNQISHAATEQAAGIGQINEAAIQLDRVTQENAAFVEKITMAAKQLAARADTLSGAVNVFRL